MSALSRNQPFIILTDERLISAVSGRSDQRDLAYLNVRYWEKQKFVRSPD
jgi:hypothetical protein